jgi:hypothetical protein
VINPIQSARLRTAGTFQFRYGRVEVVKKKKKKRSGLPISTSGFHLLIFPSN